jgi:CheY-like chemotaxis protein
MDAGKPPVLVVDDTDELRELVVEFVDALGFPVSSASNGVEAIRMLPEVRPAVVLLDMNMPELDGLGFLAQLRGMADGAALAPVVIAMSADRTFSATARSFGAFDFLEKPIDAAVLEAALEVAIEGRPMGEVDRALHLEQIDATHQADDVRRDELLRQAGIDAPKFHREVLAMLRWLSAYFGLPKAFAILLRGKRLELFEAIGMPGFTSGTTVSDRFCAELTRNGESLLLHDAAHHPVYGDHGGRQASFRGYVATPIRTRDGLSIGTLTLKSPEPLDPAAFRTEDLMLLRYFADAFGDYVRRSTVEPVPVVGVFSDPGLLEPGALRAVIASRVATPSPRAYPFSLVRLVGTDAEFVREVGHIANRLDSRQRLAVGSDERSGAAVCVGSAEQLASIADALRSQGLRFTEAPRTVASPFGVDVVDDLLAAP